MILLLLVFSFFCWSNIFWVYSWNFYSHQDIAFSWNEMGGSDFWGKRTHWQDYDSQSFSVSPFSLSVHIYQQNFLKVFKESIQLNWNLKKSSTIFDCKKINGIQQGIINVYYLRYTTCIISLFIRCVMVVVNFTHTSLFYIWSWNM